MSDSPARAQYREALAWLLGLVDLERRPMTREMQAEMTLARPAALLERLGNPQKDYITALVAGSKGKGSTATILATILQGAGYHTGLYSKPHLHTYRERARIDGVLISESEFADEIALLRPHVEALTRDRPELGTPTTFETTTALALDYFSRRKVQVAVVEVGLGGRLDATNVVDADLSIITPISFEHTAVLGNTLGEIASEKAGIIKTHKPSLYSPQAEEALGVLERVARERESPAAVGGRDWTWMGENQSFEVASPHACAGVWNAPWRYTGLTLSLLGSHQIENAATAIAASRALGDQYALLADAGAVRQGLAAARWPGRLELISPQRPDRAPIVVDAAHNADSARRLVAGVRENFDYNRLWLVIAMYADKDVEGFIRAFNGQITRAWTVQTRQPRCRPAATLARELVHLQVDAEPTAGTADALQVATRAASPDDLILVTGSLSIVAEAREALGLVPDDERDPD